MPTAFNRIPSLSAFTLSNSWPAINLDVINQPDKPHGSASDRQSPSQDHGGGGSPRSGYPAKTSPGPTAPPLRYDPSPNSSRSTMVRSMPSSWCVDKKRIYGRHFLIQDDLANIMKQAARIRDIGRDRSGKISQCSETKAVPRACL